MEVRSILNVGNNVINPRAKRGLRNREVEDCVEEN